MYTPEFSRPFKKTSNRRSHRIDPIIEGASNTLSQKSKRKTHPSLHSLKAKASKVAHNDLDPQSLQTHLEVTKSHDRAKDLKHPNPTPLKKVSLYPSPQSQSLRGSALNQPFGSKHLHKLSESIMSSKLPQSPLILSDIMTKQTSFSQTLPAATVPYGREEMMIQEYQPYYCNPANKV